MDRGGWTWFIGGAAEEGFRLGRLRGGGLLAGALLKNWDKTLRGAVLRLLCCCREFGEFAGATGFGTPAITPRHSQITTNIRINR